MDDEIIKNQVKEIFTEYLTLHKHRKTPERYAILDHIYSTKFSIAINAAHLGSLAQSNYVDSNFVAR